VIRLIIFLENRDRQTNMDRPTRCFSWRTPKNKDVHSLMWISDSALQ